MSLVTITNDPGQAAEAIQQLADGERWHYPCCEDNLAICGLDLTHARNSADPEPSEDDCPLCALALDENMPCPNFDCPYGVPR